MCSIAGLITTDPQARDLSLVKKMQASLRHRGPDGEGFYISPRVILAINRLAIIDIKGGNQPLYSESGDIVIIGNGEIYNYPELHRQLLRGGHKLATGSDIETVIHLYQDYGLKMVHYLRGMFALAIFDRHRHQVHLIRDRMGEKPLYYSRLGKKFLFASEMAALSGLPGIDKRLNLPAIDQFIHYYFVPEPATLFLGITKLLPAHGLTINIRTGRTRTWKYWDPRQTPVVNRGAVLPRLKQTLAEACRLNLRSDVPVGIALSGGMDSSTILALCARYHPENLTAFSIGYPGRPVSDERNVSRKLAESLHVRFIDREITPRQVVDSFPGRIFSCGDPIADISQSAIYEVSRLARNNHIKVLLAGLGGDELFWGYPWVRQITEELVAGKSRRHDDQFYSHTTAYSQAELFIKYLYHPHFKKQLPPVIFPDFPQKKAAVRESLYRISSVWLLGDAIALNDRLSMANSVESRLPLLDYRLVELIYATPALFNGYQNIPKYWLKKAMSGILPPEVLARPKRGFTPPVYDWIFHLLKSYGYLLKSGFLVQNNIISGWKIQFLVLVWPLLPSWFWYPLYQQLVLEVWGREYAWKVIPEQIKPIAYEM